MNGQIAYAGCRDLVEQINFGGRDAGKVDLGVGRNSFKVLEVFGVAEISPPACEHDDIARIDL